MKRYMQGRVLRLTGTFTDLENADPPLLPDGPPIDPDAVTFKIERPDDTVTIYEYGTDLALKRGSTGYYYVDVVLDVPGRWYRRTDSTGTGQDADEDVFEVIPTRIG